MFSKTSTRPLPPDVSVGHIEASPLEPVGRGHAESVAANVLKRRGIPSAGGPMRHGRSLQERRVADQVFIAIAKATDVGAATAEREVDAGAGVLAGAASCNGMQPYSSAAAPPSGPAPIKPCGVDDRLKKAKKISDASPHTAARASDEGDQPDPPNPVFDGVVTCAPDKGVDGSWRSSARPDSLPSIRSLAAVAPVRPSRSVKTPRRGGPRNAAIAIGIGLAASAVVLVVALLLGTVSRSAPDTPADDQEKAGARR